MIARLIKTFTLVVIASAAKQSMLPRVRTGLLRCTRNDGLGASA